MTHKPAVLVISRQSTFSVSLVREACLEFGAVGEVSTFRMCMSLGYLRGGVEELEFI